MWGKIILLFALATVAYCDERINFVFHHGGAQTRFNVGNFADIRNHPAYNRARSLLLFHYGEGQTPTTTQVADIISSYNERNSHNFVVIVYDAAGVINTDNANALAQGITTALISLFDIENNSGQTALIGFALGAQIMARASRQVASQSSRRHIIARLTGLDPWLLGPVTSITIGRLSSADAQFVESVHTESANRGDLGSNGHVWFFVNGGIEQPMCNQISPIARWDCSHLFAMTVWAESVRSATPIFPALQCDTWQEFTAGACNNNEVTFLGRSTEFNRRGPYMLRTFLSPPFARPTPLP